MTPNILESIVDAYPALTYTATGVASVVGSAVAVFGCGKVADTLDQPGRSDASQVVGYLAAWGVIGSLIAGVTGVVQSRIHYTDHQDLAKYAKLVTDASAGHGTVLAQKIRQAVADHRPLQVSLGDLQTTASCKPVYQDSPAPDQFACEARLTGVESLPSLQQALLKQRLIPVQVADLGTVQADKFHENVTTEFSAGVFKEQVAPNSPVDLDFTVSAADYVRATGAQVAANERAPVLATAR